MPRGDFAGTLVGKNGRFPLLRTTAMADCYEIIQCIIEQLTCFSPFPEPFRLFTPVQKLDKGIHLPFGEVTEVRHAGVGIIDPGISYLVP